MPSVVKVRVIEARNISPPGRLTAEEPIDVSIQITFAGQEERTSICRKTVAPQWDQEFRFEVAEDTILQNGPIEFKIVQHDSWQASGGEDAFVGKVFIDLNPLLTRIGEEDWGGRGRGGVGGGRGGGREGGIEGGRGEELLLQGLYPLYDTLKGVRGDLALSVKLQHVGNENPFRDSSIGVRFFSASVLDPEVFQVDKILGFVEELVVENDPEFEWKDQFRHSRSSNESRQTLLYRLDASVRRQLGKKVLDLKGNALLAYQLHFDVEGDSGLVARAYGTACRVRGRGEGREGGREGGREEEEGGREEGEGERVDGLPLVEKRDKREQQEGHGRRRRGWGGGERGREGGREEEGGGAGEEDVQLLTLTEFEPCVRMRLGGLVTAKSETRDGWWFELREEVKGHALLLGCTHIVGYREQATIHDDVCLLQAAGTAAVLRWGPALPPSFPPSLVGGDEALFLSPSSSNTPLPPPFQPPSFTLSPDGHPPLSLSSSSSSSTSHRHLQQQLRQQQSSSSSLPAATVEGEMEGEREGVREGGAAPPASVRRGGSGGSVSSLMPTGAPKGGGREGGRGGGRARWKLARPCHYCHLPYPRRRAPFAHMRIVPCQVCGRKWVPEGLLATIEPPVRLLTRGEGVLIEVGREGGREGGNHARWK
ncbi:hypothetical protein VYU27_008412 [Nannochloropsis oceanica]